jgi:uncharacterized protein (TIGR03435 family)
MSLLLSLVCGSMISFAQSTPPAMNRWAKPDFPPSYRVHISPSQISESGTSDSAGPDYWSALGYDLRHILAKLYHIDESRIALPSSLEDGSRYDFALVLPKAESQEEKDRLVQKAIGEEFHVTMAFEKRAMDVYVLTAPEGRTRAMKLSAEPAGIAGGSMSSLSVAVASPHDGPPTKEEIQAAAEKLIQPVGRSPIREVAFVDGVSTSSSTMEEFCHALEMGLDRLVVDETNLKGRYDVEVQGAGSTQQFISLLRDQLGLMMAPGRRDVRMLIVRPKTEAN